MVLERGFAGTTIDDIISQAAITKGGFFYHFEGKRELARALVERYIRMDSVVFQQFKERADTLSEDPLQRTLIFLNLFTEMVAGMTQLHPGCIIAAFTYEAQQFDDEIRQRMRESMMEWRDMIAMRFARNRRAVSSAHRNRHRCPGGHVHVLPGGRDHFGARVRLQSGPYRPGPGIPYTPALHIW